ncbi:hypothetical protein [Klebsiella aerogenes]
MKNSSNKTSLRIGGNMSEKGADKAGIILACCLGAAAVLFAFAAIVWAFR